MRRIKYADQNIPYSWKKPPLLSKMTFSNAASERYSVATIAIWGIDWKRMKKRGVRQFLRKPVLSRIGFCISGKIKAGGAAARCHCRRCRYQRNGTNRQRTRSYIYKSSLSKLNVIGATTSRILSTSRWNFIHSAVYW